MTTKRSQPFSENSSPRKHEAARPRWLRLDNAAKIYPAAKRRKWNNVFRLSATLTEPVDTAILYAALGVTLRRFPSISVRLRRGLFWYYLDEIKQAPQLQEDGPWPCMRMYLSDIRTCAFRVLYYENRIAVEVFHALTDGTGALIFLKTLVAEYLSQKKGITVPSEEGVLSRGENPTGLELEDSFLRHGGTVSASRRTPNAYQLTGTRESDGFVHLTTGILDVGEALVLAKRYGVSLTVLLASVLIEAIVGMQAREEPRHSRQKPVAVLLPVNLRPFFGSETIRNFALFVTPGIDPRLGEYSLEEITKLVHHHMGMELTAKQLGRRIAANVKAERVLALKLTPLFVKNMVMKLVYNRVGERKSCITMSNLGAVELPEEMAPFVKRMDVVLGMQAVTPNNCGVLSYGGKLYINFSRNIREATLERLFFTRLRRLGLSVKVESNQKDG